MDYSGQRFEQYQIIEKLGQGGMATVYKAYDTRLERDVAIKVVRKESIPPEQLARILKRFEREAKALAKFLHPNIVPVHDYGYFKGAPYLVMAYLPGGTLKERIGKPVAVDTALAWVAPIAAALSYAHQRGVIHRDVKPSNILITEDGSLMLSDFGIAQILEESTTQLTATGMGVGTPEYMAPEQWQGKASAASDQYALGVVMYELVTGQKPYSADTPAAIILMQATEPLRAPSQLVGGVSEALEKVLYKALARNPQDRYENVAAFQGALGGVLDSGETQEPASVAKPAIQPGPKPAASVIDSEGATRDALEPSSAAEEGSTTAGEKRAIGGLPKWAVWAGLGIGAIVLVGILIGILRDPPDQSENGEAAVAMQVTETALATEEPTPLATETLPPTKTSTITPTPTEALGVGSTQVNKVDGAEMVYVPAGEFLMGSSAEDIDWVLAQDWCSDCKRSWYEDEQPEHNVYLDAYYIYKYEVTNEQYAEFLNIAGNQKEGRRIYREVPEELDIVYWYGDSKILNHINLSNEVWIPNEVYEDHPVSEITWYGANAYCKWVGGRLPSEAEWEKAARGTDKRWFPWGNEIPDNKTINFNSDGPKPIGSFKHDKSPYGVYDMGGNVSEWVNDYYNSYYYKEMVSLNPTGPDSGRSKVIRGGNWKYSIRDVFSANRSSASPHYSVNAHLGFRCVIDVDQ